MNEKVLENEDDLLFFNSPEFKPKMGKKFNRQNNITLEEDDESVSSLKSVNTSKPLTSILANAKKNTSSIFAILPNASSTLPKLTKNLEKYNFNKINSQKSLNQIIQNDPNSLSVTTNPNDESVSRKSSFNSV
ncbi:unnamed protein product, partial [Brachionus calyciflorus]